MMMMMMICDVKMTMIFHDDADIQGYIYRHC